MKHEFLYGREKIELALPDDAVVYESAFPAPAGIAEDLLRQAVERPIGCEPLCEKLKGVEGNVVIVVSDITRPVQYHTFLPQMLARIEEAGIERDRITILVATGMHRPSTVEERVEMFGPEVASNYRIVDHMAEDDGEVVELDGKSWSGHSVRVNRHYVEAGFKIATGLVEPHFMAGFSGGRKAICPGLVSLDTIERFHGYEFLSGPAASNGSLEGNPCHEESLSVAKLAGVDFLLNVVLDKDRNIVRMFGGDLEAAHEAACAFARESACPQVREQADVVVTSCGGYPLDATFYQCVKAMVSCMPAVRAGGKIICFGRCSEGVGSAHYTELMVEFANRWEAFITDIQKPGVFSKDQWEFQMQCRPLAHVGQVNLLFATCGLSADVIDTLSVGGTAIGPRDAGEAVQELVDQACQPGSTVAAIPEGPYCAPLAKA